MSFATECLLSELQEKAKTLPPDRIPTKFRHGSRRYTDVTDSVKMVTRGDDALAVIFERLPSEFVQKSTVVTLEEAIARARERCWPKVVYALVALDQYRKTGAPLSGLPWRVSITNECWRFRVRIHFENCICVDCSE